LFLGISVSWGDQEVQPLATFFIDDQMPANLLRSFDEVNRLDDSIDFAGLRLEQELTGIELKEFW